jgi:hypothetical protein
MKQQLFLLPASDPDDMQFGNPNQLQLPENYLPFTLSFGRMVWYTPEIRVEAMQQMTAITGAFDKILVGFSKSGLAALNLAIEYPSFFNQIIVFDAPLLNRSITKYGINNFYASDEDYWADHPLTKLETGYRLGNSQVHFITESSFKMEMLEALPLFRKEGCSFSIYEQDFSHHWDSGWVPFILAELPVNHR